MTLVARNLALLAGLVLCSAQAVYAAPKAKPKAKPAAHLTIDNQRGVMLVQLTVTPKGDKKSAPVIIAREIEAGTKIDVPFPAGGCIFALKGVFDDESGLEFDAVDLCKDHTLTLVDDPAAN
jgi:hypothetical protein